MININKTEINKATCYIFKETGKIISPTFIIVLTIFQANYFKLFYSSKIFGMSMTTKQIEMYVYIYDMRGKGDSEPLKLFVCCFVSVIQKSNI